MGLWPEVTAISGAAQCLAALSGLCPLAIATNATVSRRPMIERALDRVGMLSYFQEIFCFTELGFRKDQLEFWLAVEQSLGVPLRHIAMVGDSLEQDVLAPTGFGVQAVWFNEEGRQQSSAVPVPTVIRLELFAGIVKGAL